jgi:hypothetical protein
MTKIKIGDRVEHDYLGTGTVVEELRGWAMHRVLWDDAPDPCYNLSVNPCAVHNHKLRLLPPAGRTSPQRPPDGATTGATAEDTKRPRPWRRASKAGTSGLPVGERLGQFGAGRGDNVPGVRPMMAGPREERLPERDHQADHEGSERLLPVE